MAANCIASAGSLSIPIVTSPSLGEFGPQLSLSYDSDAGNGPFGIGWSLSLPAITRKTDKGLPQYRDAQETDIFILYGVGELVPAYQKNPDDSWKLNPQGRLIFDAVTRNGYKVKAYQPRKEGLFARIERWMRLGDDDTHWRAITKDNILTVYGITSESRIADPAHPNHVFSWLICQSYDDKGNAIVYDYVAENADNIDLIQISECNRSYRANRYLKTIRYGNRQPLLIDPTLPSLRQAHVHVSDFNNANWMFEVVFDYGEGHYQEMPADADGQIFATATAKPPVGGKWLGRPDPFSSYRSGFEVRSYRLCQRVLMLNHFADELGKDDYLVRATAFTYLPKPSGTFIIQVHQSNFKLIAQPTLRYLKQSLSPLEFGQRLCVSELKYPACPCPNSSICVSIPSIPSLTVSCVSTMR